MSEFGFTLLAFLVAIAVLVTVHEYGHFWVARRLGVKVLRFSIGFGRPLWRRVGRSDGVEYVIGAIPLGGYVKMLDEREGPVASSERHRAFNQKGLVARTAIVVAGPLANFLFAIVAFWGVFVLGEPGLKPLVGEVVPASLAAEAGFAPGDEIISINGETTPSWSAVLYQLAAARLEQADIAIAVSTRTGGRADLTLSSRDLADPAESKDPLADLGLKPDRPRIPPILGKVISGGPGDLAGLSAGDRVTAIDGRALDSWETLVEVIQGSANKTLLMSVDRDGQQLNLQVQPKAVTVDGEVVGRIQVEVKKPATDFGESYRVTVRKGVFEAAGAAVRETAEFSALIVKVFWKILTGEASVKNLGGPLTIADAAGTTASIGFVHFLKFLAMVSISLGVINLLPVPVLDGGHLLFFLAEAVKGSPLSATAEMVGQRVGLALLLGLMSIALYVDFSRYLN